MGRQRHVISQFVTHVVPGVVRPLHILWNQLIGFIFVVLALLPIPSAIRHPSVVRVVLSFSFAALMAYFGITSFWRARKISRS
jgi:hypothetical protein